MFFPEGRVRVFVHRRPVDMRKRFTGLIALTKHALAQDPLSGHLYVYINRRGDYLKALYWDRSGFCIWSKRLSQGRLAWWPTSAQASQRLCARELQILLWNGNPEEAAMAEHWRRVA